MIDWKIKLEIPESLQVYKHIIKRDRREEKGEMSRCMKEIKVMDKEKIAKERKVIPDPIDDRKFQE